MQQLKIVETKIEHLRKYLHGLIEQNENLFTEEIITVSQDLDKVLNEYNLLITSKIA